MKPPRNGEEVGLSKLPSAPVGVADTGAGQSFRWANIEPRMMAAFLRECVVLLIGVAVALVASLFGNAGRNFAALVGAMLLPIAFCLGRAALLRYPTVRLSRVRRFVWNLTTALSIIALLLFEMSVGMFAGANGIPIGAWAVVATFGATYLTLRCIADWLAT